MVIKMSEKRYDLQDADLMTAAEASRRWGYESGYVRQMRKKYPEKIPEGEIRMFGKTLVITRAGMEQLTGKKEKVNRFFVVEEDNWSVMDQTEVNSFEKGKEQLKVLVLKNLDSLDVTNVTLDYIDAKKHKFGIKIRPGKSFYILTE
ncbi:TPA: helix-turn-helix domain-containing protein [Enterococcus faecium]